ncbi:MAG: glycogen debranching enzyme N-terminal domain-containing protein, partial [Verrucomicrobia bacterium]|nr:glycogen debranching enzyme N-terminal domain-containing protein [Verrucomicrobiota bacterium]
YVGDIARFELESSDPACRPPYWQARLRTNLGRAEALRIETIAEVETGRSPSLASWHDVPMQWSSRQKRWFLELPLAEEGWFEAKAYAIDARGWQRWVEGANTGISVHPAHCRSANTIYCAFVRLFGKTAPLRRAQPDPRAPHIAPLDAEGYAVIPPSGTFRDLILRLPHIIDRLGCRIIHLLPIHPAPATFARMGRLGSPYACLDLFAVDPALVEFDRKRTGLEQFQELADAVHARGARLFLDIVVNHTGWGAKLYEERPKWFARNPDGTFKSPGAWGVEWGDLVELRHDNPELRRYIAEALLTWRRRGVDGFRCDAGYMVPLDAWRCIIARVRREFPDTVFLLEGLGGSWQITETLLTRGGMQWAYSELFQNYTGEETARYLDYALAQSRRAGIYVHYSETHDNNRLAARGRAWSLLRNRLCALASVNGAFGFTCGVEWLAEEKIDVHELTGLAWGNPDNIVEELARLNRLLSEHPCFFADAELQRLSRETSPVYALRRIAAGGTDGVLVLINTDPDKAHSIELPLQDLRMPGAPTGSLPEAWIDLLGQQPPLCRVESPETARFEVPPAGAYCLAKTNRPRGLAGKAYRRRKAQEAFLIRLLSKRRPAERLSGLSLEELARELDAAPEPLLAAIAGLDDAPDLDAGEALAQARAAYPKLVHWDEEDVRRTTLVPPDHWIIAIRPYPFRLHFRPAGQDLAQHAESVPVRNGHVGVIAPERDLPRPSQAEIEMERYEETLRRARGRLLLLPAAPQADCEKELPLREGTALLANGIGGMARPAVDFGRIYSKYDCLLAANLDPRVPSDRHVFVKRARLWLNADGFVTPLNATNLAGFRPGPPARWRFRAAAGDGREIELLVEASMLPGRNATILAFHRPELSNLSAKTLPPEANVSLTVRVDIEDRNFHQETKRNKASERHFARFTKTLEQSAGFGFTPAPERALYVCADKGAYHPQPEWCEGISHPVEASRGQEARGDAYSPGWFEIPLGQGETARLALVAEPSAGTPGALAALTAGLSSQNSRPAEAESASSQPAFLRRLGKALDDFLVRREDALSVIAGYPWFLDWGRDALIAARGLIRAGKVQAVWQILRLFARHEDRGTLPNAFFGVDASNRDTSDAPLWFGLACEEFAEALREEAPGACWEPIAPHGRSLAETLRSIAVHYLRGAPHGARMDPESALVWSPAHFTWMDTNFPACTPREGYPVELQALWIRLLRYLDRIGVEPEEEPWTALARQAQESFERLFWLEEHGWYADLLAAEPNRPAAAAVPRNDLRPNCLLPVALGLARPDRARSVVAAARRFLLVPGALRSLAPLPVDPPLPIHGPDGRLLNDPARPYQGRYEGDEDTRRKPAYHNGTGWVWWLPIFCEALAQSWDCRPEALAAARAYLASLDPLLLGGCVGHLPELVDGDAPHLQRGCDAQAWSASESFRVGRLLLEQPPPPGESPA